MGVTHGPCVPCLLASLVPASLACGEASYCPVLSRRLSSGIQSTGGVFFLLRLISCHRVRTKGSHQGLLSLAASGQSCPRASSSDAITRSAPNDLGQPGTVPARPRAASSLVRLQAQSCRRRRQTLLLAAWLRERPPALQEAASLLIEVRPSTHVLLLLNLDVSPLCPFRGLNSPLWPAGPGEDEC